MRPLILIVCLAMAGCVADPVKPPDAAELYGSGSRSRSSSEYPAGPSVSVSEIDGRPAHALPAFLSPGMHRVRLLIVVLDVEANPEIEFWAETNRRYEIFAAYHGYTEFALYCRDITSNPPKGVFAATVPKSVFSPKLKYFDGPARPAESKQAPNHSPEPTPSAVH